MTLIRCKTSAVLRDGLADALECLRSDNQVRQAMEQSSVGIKEGLQQLLREGWIVESDDASVSKTFSDSRWPSSSLVRYRDAYLVRFVRKTLETIRRMSRS